MKKLLLILGNGFTIDLLSHLDINSKVDMINLFSKGDTVNCVLARGVALLQKLLNDCIFITNIPRESLASMVGNALPSLFSQIQCGVIYNYLLNKTEVAYA